MLNQNGVVATALFEESHHGEVFTVGDLTIDVNDLLRKIGETHLLTPKAVGNYLRSLGFNPLKLGNIGRGLRNDAAARQAGFTSWPLIWASNGMILRTIRRWTMAGLGSPAPASRTRRTVSKTTLANFLALKRLAACKPRVRRL
jgi:hypothetical protein